MIKLIAIVFLAASAGCGASLRPLCSTSMPPVASAPASAEARVAADYVAAFNAGDPAALVAYARAHRSPLAEQTSDDELAHGYRHMARARRRAVPAPRVGPR